MSGSLSKAIYTYRYRSAHQTVSLCFSVGLINHNVCLFLDLYYNENYAGLAAEIFGLTETANTQSDDSTEQSCDEPQLPSSEEVVTLGDSNGFILDPVEDAPAQDLADDPTTELIVS